MDRSCTDGICENFILTHKARSYHPIRIVRLIGDGKKVSENFLFGHGCTLPDLGKGWLGSAVVNYIFESQTTFLRVGFQGTEGNTVGTECYKCDTTKGPLEAIFDKIKKTCIKVNYLIF